MQMPRGRGHDLIPPRNWDRVPNPTKYLRGFVLQIPRRAPGHTRPQASRPKSQAETVGPRNATQLARFLSKKLGKLATKFSAEGFGKELGRECGLRLGKDLGTKPDSLLGKEPDKEF
jgi:hypothetical protein